MDYEKKYKEAMERMKLCVRTGLKITPEYIFHELAESEDKKIRKWIIDDITFNMNNEPLHNSEYRKKAEKAIAWLEKQGQVKESHISQHENRICKENDDSLTSEDDRIREALVEMVHDTTGDDLWIDYNVHKEEALDWLERQGEHANFRNKIQVGDKVTRNEDGVLVNLSQLDRVAKKNEKQCKQKFEMKTAEESLGIDSDTYNKIVDECIFGEQKPEENKGNIGGISANWSVEDEQHIDSLLKRLDALCRNKFERTRFAISEDRDWLKSLRPQNRWKPSDEQIKVCKEVYADLLSAKGFDLGTVVSELNRLEEGLKKKGE